MALRTRKDFFVIETGVRTEEIFKTSRLLSHITGVHVQPNKAIVGENAFAHEAGIHQDGVLKEKLTYEIMKPKDIGRPSNKLVLGKHSGRHALTARLKDLGFDLAGSDLDRAFKSFKDLADRKKEVYDEDLIAIVTDEATQTDAVYQLEYLHVISGTGVIPSATVKLKKDGESYQDSGVGDGPEGPSSRLRDPRGDLGQGRAGRGGGEGGLRRHAGLREGLLDRRHRGERARLPERAQPHVTE